MVGLGEEVPGRSQARLSGLEHGPEPGLHPPAAGPAAGAATAWWQKAPAATENTPHAAAAWLTEHPDLPGPLWSEIGFASYLEFALPSRPPWMDTRFEVFPVEQWEQYRAVSSGEWNWQALLDDAGVIAAGSKVEQPAWRLR